MRRPPSSISGQQAGSARPPRPGVAVLFVLLLLSITLALSYAAVRSQYTGLLIQRNSNRQIAAREVAATGLTMALKKMHANDWGGVGSSLSGSLGSGRTFQVTYTAGDPSLSAGQPDYGDLPYRVTLLSTGSAADPDNPASPATYQIRAVVRLVPRAFGPEPSDWNTMQNYTVFQTHAESFEVDIPCRFEGRIRIQGKLKIAPKYPDYSDAWQRYLDDLGAMPAGGQPDYRPFNGPVDLPYSEQDWLYRHALQFRLGVTANDVDAQPIGSDWNKPELGNSYQIYQGGPSYTIPTVGATLENTTLNAEPLTNPLGIYYRNGTVEIKSNVTIRGSLYCKDDIKITGSNVHFQPVELPALYGSTAPVRLPVASCKNFYVESTGSGDLTGLLAVFEELNVKKGPKTTQTFAVVGRVIARRLYVKERQPWETTTWQTYYFAFLAQLWGYNPQPYFPVWMASQSRNPQPLLTFKADSGSIKYHWRYPGDRVYVRDPSDSGLRWDLLEWTENP